MIVQSKKIKDKTNKNKNTQTRFPIIAALLASSVLAAGLSTMPEHNVNSPKVHCSRDKVSVAVHYSVTVLFAVVLFVVGFGETLL